MHYAFLFAGKSFGLSCASPCNEFFRWLIHLAIKLNGNGVLWAFVTRYEHRHISFILTNELSGFSVYDGRSAIL